MVYDPSIKVPVVIVRSLVHNLPRVVGSAIVLVLFTRCSNYSGGVSTSILLVVSTVVVGPRTRSSTSSVVKQKDY